MRLYRKEDNTVHILSFPTENAEKGDYLMIEDTKQNKALMVQVIDVQFANVPGILEELLRDTTNDENLNGQDLDPLEVGSHITYIQDARLLVCKIRASLENQKLTTASTWLPSRSQSTIKRLPTTALLNLVKINHNLPINLGETKD
jgi:hypothetical protein